MSKTKPITIWYRFNKKNNLYEHNHIEDGHITGNKPVPKSDQQQKSWPNAKWKKDWAFLDGSKVILGEPVL